MIEKTSCYLNPHDALGEKNYDSTQENQCRPYKHIKTFCPLLPNAGGLKDNVTMYVNVTNLILGYSLGRRWNSCLLVQ